MPAHVRRFSAISNDGDAESPQRPKRRRKVSVRNARFDAMIDTMNIVRCPPKDIPRQITHPKSLSLIKMHASPDGSCRVAENDDSSEQSSRSASSSSRRGIKPLPSWLANTFSTLVADHPLRLLLPAPQGDDHVEKQGSRSAIEDVFVFNPPEPSDERSDSSSSYGVADVVGTSWCDTKVTASDHSRFPSAFSHASTPLRSDNQPLPFSTPGPEYAHSSLPVPPGNIDYLASYPYASSASFPESPSVEFFQCGCYDDPITNSFSSDSFVESAACMEYAPAIYSTPGPSYCVTHHLHFDSPIEDPMDSDAPQAAYDIDYNSLDFSWKPFDRKGQGPHLVQPADTYMPDGSLGSDVRIQNDSRLASKEEVSPSPFRFLPPIDDTNNTSPPPVSIEPSSPSSLCHTSYVGSAFAPAHGVFISPLRSQPTPSASSLHIQASTKQPGSPHVLSPINEASTQRELIEHKNAASGKQ